MLPFHAFVTTGLRLELPEKSQQNVVLSQSLPQTEVRQSHACTAARYCEFCSAECGREEDSPEQV